MSKYTASVQIVADADRTFSFLSDFKNMPLYMPTLHSIRGTGAGRVEVEGTVDVAGEKKDYKANGWFEVDDVSRIMEWGSPGDRQYSGRLSVRRMGKNARVDISLNFEPNPGHEDNFDQEMSRRAEVIQSSLDRTVECIKELLEAETSRVAAYAA